jgi:hypothetical protein
MAAGDFSIAALPKTVIGEELQPYAFRPYRTDVGSMDHEQILAWSQSIADAIDKQGLSNPFTVYQRLLDLLASPRFEVRPLRGLMSGSSEERVIVSLRHDCDSNVVPAYWAAEHLADRGMIGSFFLLHTSSYYGTFNDQIFSRQRGLPDVVSTLARHEQEIGLHIDPLHVYFGHDIDGTEAVLTELNWLRAQGLHITGIAAHNSAPVYGAENFEIMEGLALNDRRAVTWQGRTAPLQTITWRASGIAYSGNYPAPPDAEDASNLEWFLAHAPADALRRADWQAIYLLHNPVFSRRNDVSIWLIGRDRWSIAIHRPIKQLLANISSIEVFEWLGKAARGNRICIVIHPDYFTLHG